MEILPDTFQTRGGPIRLPKRDRTRRLLISAAIDAFSAHGLTDTTMQEIAVAAGMTTGTVYNHFRDKTEIVRAVGVFIAQTVRERSRPARAVLTSGAEQVAAGCWRYLGLASASPAWASLVLEVAAVDPVFRKTLASFVATELRKGIRGREFSVASEAAGLDLIIGTTMEGMRRLIAGGRKSHATAIVATVLCGLGVAPARARRIAAKPLPLFDA